MNIKTVRLDTIYDASYNPRVTLKPGDAEWESLKNSISHFGYVEPIVVNERNNVVIGGHQRLHVMRDMGVEEAEVVLVDLDENDEKALNVALNKINGKWDAEKLEDLMRELDLGGYDIDLTGFSRAELDTLYTGCLEDDDGDETSSNNSGAGTAALNELGKESVPDEITANARNIEAGQIWRCGRHLIACGDSFDEAHIKKLVGNTKFQMLLTDPPYNYKNLEQKRNEQSNNKIEKKFINLAKRLEDMDEIDPTKIEYALDWGIPFVFIFCNNHDLPNWCDLVKKHGYYSDIHVMAKLNCMPCAGDFRRSLEYIAVGRNCSVDTRGVDTAIISKWLKETEDMTPIEDWVRSQVCYTKNTESMTAAKECGMTGLIDHPTVKPQKILIQKLMACSKDGDNILDLFSGSGSTMIACEKLGRTCYTNEFLPKYVNLTIDRWEAFTGQVAVREA